MTHGHGTNYIYILTGGIHKKNVIACILNWIFLLLQRFFKDFMTSCGPRVDITRCFVFWSSKRRDPKDLSNRDFKNFVPQ